MENRATQTQYYLGEEESNSLQVRWARRFAHHFANYCLCDQDSIYQVLRYKWATRRWLRTGPLKGDHGEGGEQAGIISERGQALRERKIQRLWPLVVLLYYLVMTVVLCSLLAHQFELDFYTAKLEHMQIQNAGAGGAAAPAGPSGREFDSTVCEQRFGHNSSKCERERDYRQHIQTSRRLVKLLGNPYANMGFIFELGLAAVYISYMHPQLVINFGPEYRLFLYELLLREAEEFARCEAMVRHEARLVAESSLNFVGAAIQLGYRELGRVPHKASAVAVSEEAVALRRLNSPPQREGHDLVLLLRKCPSNFGVAKRYRDHQLVVRQLKLLLQSGRLHPINRSSREWRQEVAGALVRANVGNLIYSSILDWIILLLMEPVSGTPLEFETPMDYAMVLLIWLYFQVSVVGCNYHLLSFLIHCQNQKRYINHLIGRIRELLRCNERHFVETLQGAPSSSCASESHEQMNARLLDLFLEYRIFLAQLRAFLTGWQHALVISLMIMFLTPLIGRAYAPYVLGKLSRSLFSFYALNTTIFADCLLAPLCALECCGRKLYSAFSSLLAHTIKLDEQARDRFGGRAVYMEHTIDLLRKELDDPHKMTGHFITQVAGFQATFPSLMELHFYFGVLLLSLHFQIDAWKTLLGDRLDDPFLIKRPN